MRLSYSILLSVLGGHAIGHPFVEKRGPPALDPSPQLRQSTTHVSSQSASQTSAETSTAPLQPTSAPAAASNSLATPPQNRFNFYWPRDTNNTEIEQLKHCYQVASQIWSNILDIKLPINVHMRSGPIFKEGFMASTNTRSIPVAEGEKTLELPAALYKQRTDAKLELYPSGAVLGDMTITVANDAPFAMLYNKTDSPNSRDCRAIAVHEILHGLGFTDQLKAVGDHTNSSLWKMYKTELSYDRQTYTDFREEFVRFFDALFDRFVAYNTNLHSKTSPVYQRVNTIFDRIAELVSGTVVKRISGRSRADEYFAFMQDIPEAQEMAHRLDGVFGAEEALVFQTLDGHNVALHTNHSRTSYKGSQMMHLDLTKYENSPEFVMTPRALSQSLESKIATVYNLSGSDNIDLNLAVGPLLRSMVQTLGWKLREGVIHPYYG